MGKGMGKDGTQTQECGRRQALSSDDDDRMTIGELARATGVTLRALRFYQSKGLLAPHRDGAGRVFSLQDRERLDLILQGKRLGFTLCEIREILAARDLEGGNTLPINRRRCVEQIKFLELQRRDLDRAIGELREIYSCMFRDLLPAVPERKAS